MNKESKRMSFSQMCAALPEDFSWGDSLTPDVFQHIEAAILQAATRETPSELTDEQIIERMKALGINWSEGGRGEFGYAIGSFDRMSLSEARALLQTAPKGDGNDSLPEDDR